MAMLSGDPGLIVVGIDPGLSGALAVLNEDGDLDTVLMPVMGAPVRVVDGGAVARWLSECSPNLAVIEMAQAMPKQGASSTFRFGQAYGQVLGVLQTSLIPYRIVVSRRWKQDLGLSSDKEQSRRRAIELLPRWADQFTRRKDEARAEAALIAWWWLHGRNRSLMEKENRRPVS
jgi:Holliday junction resolvasome RuvABC endonuclease subunit